MDEGGMMKLNKGISFNKPKPTKEDKKSREFMRALGDAHRRNILKIICGEKE